MFLFFQLRFKFIAKFDEIADKTCHRGFHLMGRTRSGGGSAPLFGFLFVHQGILNDVS
ncbi:MAG: hypothetical protein AAGF22_02565 [Pseudomonadota bacterium]